MEQEGEKKNRGSVSKIEEMGRQRQRMDRTRFGDSRRAVEDREMSHLVTKPTKWHVRPAKTQIRLGGSESSLSA